MKIGIAGDWHGNTQWARFSISEFAARGITRVVQLGDFGLGWPGGWNQYINEVNGATYRHNVELDVVPGNHENYDWMSEQETDDEGIIHIGERIRVLPRGHRETWDERVVLFLGGAPSIDYKSRYEGKSWWPAEMITVEEAESVAYDGHADIMFTHDAPDNGTDEVQRIIDDPFAIRNWGWAGIKYAETGRERMNIAFNGVQPKVFCHGHFHVAGYKEREDTTFVSFNCDGMPYNMGVIDTETLEFVFLEHLSG